VIDSEQVRRLIQAQGNVKTLDGDKIGTFGQFYMDDDSGQPSWVTVRTGFFGKSESFVPVKDASADGSDVLVPYSKDLVKDAPRIDHDGDLSLEEEDRLYRHYRLSEAGADAGEGAPVAGGTAPEAVRRARLRRYIVIEEASTAPDRNDGGVPGSRSGG
jgi:PRC-barrel domain protein